MPINREWGKVGKTWDNVVAEMFLNQQKKIISEGW